MPKQKRHTILMHRVILGLELGNPKEGDHINRDRLDNRRSNLRITEAKVQVQNQGCTKLFKGKPTESRYRGVYKVKKRGLWSGRWKAVVAQRYLGVFDTEEEAAAAAAAYRVKTMPYAVEE
ncbi:HNH endonuclease [Kitasatospora sp. NPDC086791]|uniref:HNH endonuclease n=1 Tax=Kitasatospora sp. NPDC086791 TaxID=3155178 RepID=UPI003415C096